MYAYVYTRVRVRNIYFDNDKHVITYRGDKHGDIYVSKYVCHQRLHGVTYDQKITNDIIL